MFYSKSFSHINRFILLYFLISFHKCTGDTNIDDRLDCITEGNKVKENECLKRGCIWNPKEGKPEIPNCYFDKTKLGYKIQDKSLKISVSGIEAVLELKESAKKTFIEQLETLKLEFNYLTDRILRFRIYDPKNKRYEVPVQKTFPLLMESPVQTDERQNMYSVNVDNNTDNFQFDITRKSTKTKIFDTSIGGLVFSDQFIQVASYLPSKNTYGLGENVHKTLRHDLNYKSWPIFTKDNVVTDHEKNLYGQHPFYTVLESNGNSHGVLLLNSNAMEYTLMPYPAISFKTIGGILDFFVFVGDNPEHVIQLYTSLIGRTFMPAFWALGFQVSKDGYQNTAHVKRVIDRQIKEKIPYDVQYIDSDYKFGSQDFTIDQTKFGSLPKLIAETQRDLNLHWTPIIDPAIQANDSHYNIFTDGYHQDVFIKWRKSVPIAERQNPSDVYTDRDTMYGRVWPEGPVAYPDFLKNATHNWWVKNLQHLYSIGWRFDALWIDMNEPSNLNFGDCRYSRKGCYELRCPYSIYDNIPFKIKALWVHEGFTQLSNATLCMTAIQGENDQFRHYDVHSLYGISMSWPTQRAVHEITGKRGFVLSRSTFVSSGRYTGHWLGDNFSIWSNIRHSVIGMLEFNLFGIPYVGADICGFDGIATPDLCRRWLQLGAFYPFSRNHNFAAEEREQDPAKWAERGYPEVTEAARNALYMRYSLLPYLYTLFFKARVWGNTVVRPLFHEYPLDNNTYNIDKQFMWGPSVLISPFLFQNQTEVDIYLPEDVWYEPIGDFGRLFLKAGYLTLPDSQSHPPIHYRGGTILPVGYKKAVNTKILRQKPIQLEVYPKNKTAFGDLFWDDGESPKTITDGKYNFYKFQLLPDCKLVIEVVKSGFSSGEPLIIDKILVANTDMEEVKATIDDTIEIKSPVSSSDHIVLTVNINLNTKKTSDKWIISWKSVSNNSCNLK